MAAYDDITLTVGIDADDAIARSEELSAEINSALNNQTGRESPALQSLLRQMDQAMSRSEQLRTQMADLSTQAFYTDEYQRLIENLERYRTELAEIVRQRDELRSSGQTQSEAFRDLGRDLQEVSDRIRETRANMQAMEQAGTHVFTGEETEEYQRLAEQLGDVNNQMIILQTRAANTGASNSRATSSTRALNTQYIDLVKVLKNVIKTSAKVIVNFNKMVSSTIINGVKKLGSAMEGLNKHGNKNNDVFKKAFRTLVRYGFGVRSFYFLFRKLRKALTEGIGELAKVHEPLNASMSNIKTALADLRNSFAAAFAPIIQYVEPILTRFIMLISEAVTKVGMLIAALTGKQYAKLATTYQDYAASLDKSTKSSSKNKKATEEQNEAAKELKRTLAGFDDVEILHEDKDTNKTSTPDTDTDDIVPTLADVPVDDSINDFVKRLLDAWKNADFYEFGRILGEKLKAALESIPWDTIKETLRKIAKSIATFLNGFLETPGLFTTIGKTIAEAINSAFAFVEEWVTQFHWGSLGTAIKDLILGVLNNIEWPTIYNTMKELGAGIGKAFNAALNNREIWREAGIALINAGRAILLGFSKFLSEIDWLELGRNISGGITDALGTIRWNEEVFPIIDQFAVSLANFLLGLFNEDTFSALGTTIGNLITAALHFLDTFGTTFEEEGGWEEFGKSIAAGLNSFFGLEGEGGFDFNELASALDVWANGLLTSLQNAVIGIHWYELGQKIKEAIETKIRWKLLMYNVGKLIIAGINASIDLFAGLFDGTPISDKLKELKDLINDVAESIDLDTLSQGFKDLGDALAPFVEGFAAGLIEFFEVIIKIGGELLKALGPAMSDLADALNKMDPETLNNIGYALGAIVASLITLNGLTALAGLLHGIAGGIAHIGTAGATAGAAGGGVAVFTAALSGLSAALAGVVIGLKLSEETITGYDKEIGASTETQKKMYDAIKQVGDQYGLTETQILEMAWGLYQAEDSVQGANNAMLDLDNKLQNAGIDTEGFKEQLFGIMGQDAALTTTLNNIAEATSGTGGSADVAKQNIALFGDTLQTFANTSVESSKGKTNLLKLALDELANSGDLSKTKVAELQSKLDSMTPDNAQSVLGDIAQALTDGQIDAEDFVQVVMNAISQLPQDVQLQLAGTLLKMDSFGEESKTKGETAGKNLTDGVTKGIEDNKSDVEDEVSNLAEKSILGTMDKKTDSHSPSKEMKTRGQWLVEGLTNGITEKNNSLMGTVGTLITGALNKISNGIEGREGSPSVNALGNTLSNDFNDGINASKHYVEGTVQNLAGNITSNIKGIELRNPGTQLCIDLFNGIRESQHYPLTLTSTLAGSLKTNLSEGDYNAVGRNICQGIYDGIRWGWDWLTGTARALAENMLSEAKWALGIASPSKEFMWVAKMITTGLAEGIENTEDTALDSVNDLAKSIVDEAETANPVLDFGISFDDVLSNFSDSVSTEFENLITKLEAMADNFAVTLPSVVSGRVVPYQSSISQNREQSFIDELLNELDYINMHQLSADDIESVMERTVRGYVESIGFYIGDEDLARHVNKGNVKLSRRFNV